MQVSYFKGSTWAEIAREERLFCARLFEVARRTPAEFARWLGHTSAVTLPDDDNWELGFEVCFYRDLLWHQGKSARQAGVSQKRTFDLCLFHEDCIVVIEAKVFEPFDRAQNEVFGADVIDIPRVLGRPMDVKLIALASSRYFENHRRRGRDDTLSVFHGRISWAQLAERYGETLFSRADLLYGSSPESGLTPTMEGEGEES